jgi:hypothetical protein
MRILLAGLLLVSSALESLANVPLGFEATDRANARFIGRAAGYAVELHAGGYDLRLPSALLHVRLIGADARAAAAATEPLPGKTNYFLGREPAAWHTDIDRFARVLYRNVYAGIDVAYYGNERRLEYDFVVAPRARPDAIELAFDGAASLQCNANGDLLVRASGDTFRLHKPRAYQQTPHGRREIESRYRVLDGHRVVFEVGAYDHDTPLVIDPVLGYATYLGGSAADLANAIAVDAYGYAYVTGRTASTGFPTTSGSFRPARSSSSLGDDVFVTKLDPKGALVYSTYLGGDFSDEGLGIAVDKAGNAYVTGLTTSSNFPVTPGALKTTASSDRAFITKLSPAGDKLVYSTYLAGTSISGARAIAVDPDGNAYVTGLGFSGSFTTTPGVFQPIAKSNDAFVAKLNPAGSSFVYATFLGGTGFQDEGFAIAAGSDGVAYVTGKTDSTDFPVTAGALRTTAPGGHDAFVTSINAAGTALLYSTYLGGRGEDKGLAITVDASGNAYVTGYTYATDFPTMKPVQPKCGCESSVGGQVQSDAFVTKLSPGGALLYSSFYGGIGPDQGRGIGVDSSGAILFGGTTDGISPSTFPLVDPLKATKGLLDDAFAVRLNATGSAAVYSTFFGGQGTDFAAAMTVDSAGNLYLAGNTNSADLGPTAGAAQGTFAGGSDDAFVARIGNAALPSVPGPRRRTVIH